MTEPYEIIPDPDSPSGESMIVRSAKYFLGDQNGFTLDIWLAKLQAKAEYFASLMDNA